MRSCRYLEKLEFDCCDWSACVASDSWVELGVPPPEVIARGTRGVFEFVHAALGGGAVCVCGTVFALNALSIDVGGRGLSFDALMPLLESFRQGKFLWMERLILVMTNLD